MAWTDCDEDYECEPCPPCRPGPRDSGIGRALAVAFVGALGAAIAEELVPSVTNGLKRLFRQLREPKQPSPNRRQPSRKQSTK